MADDPQDVYQVGYKRPPAASQFKPGQSGNRKGRPKGSRNFSTDLQEMLDAKVTITEGGKRKKVSMRKAAAKQIALKAAGGDPRAIAVVREEDTRFQERQAVLGAVPAQEASQEDRLVMESIIKRIRQRMPAETEPPLETKTDSLQPTEKGSKK